MKFKKCHIYRGFIFLFLLLIYGLYTSALPDNSCQLNCKRAGLVAVGSIPHKAWIVWELPYFVLASLVGTLSRLSTHLGLGKGGKKEERWRDTDPILFLGVSNSTN